MSPKLAKSEAHTKGDDDDDDGSWRAKEEDGETEKSISS